MKLCADFLKNSERQLLHEATIEVLEKTGVYFESEDALKVFKEHGAKVEGNIVFIGEKLLENSLKNAPRTFKVYGGDEKYDFTIGESLPALAPVSGPVYIKRNGIKRLANQQDSEDVIKLVETSKVINFSNYIAIEPQDMPENKRKMYQVALGLKLSNKPFVGMTMGKGLSKQAIKLVFDFHGEEAKKARMIGIISPISPLKYDGQMLEHVFEYAKNDQPLMFASCSQPGATSPVSLAGTIVIDNAQALAGIVLAQLIKPGLPVIYGSTSTSCDMRYISPAIGSPETGLITATVASLAHSYGLPCRSGGTLTDAKCLDMQAGMEATMTLMPTLMSGVDFVLQAAGVTDSFNTVNLEKFLIDEEIISSVLRMVKGFEIDEDHLAVKLINESGPGADFLKAKHTKKHFKTELHIPTLISRESYEKWEAQGSPDSQKLAEKALKQRLEQYKPLQLDPGQEKLLSNYLNI